MATGATIVGMSARTPVGLTPESSAAAVRAHLSRVQIHPYFVGAGGAGIRAGLDPLLDPNVQGVERLTTMATYSLLQLAERLPSDVWGGRTHAPTPVLLGTPEHRPGFDASHEARLLSQLRAGTAPFPLTFEVVQRGNAGALHALGVAAQRIASGQNDLCLVGGVDSFFDADTIEWLIEQKQIATDDERSPFAPGEGACFLALMSSALRGRTRARSMGQLVAVHSALESSLIRTDDVNLARGLTAAISGAAARLASPSEVVDDIWCDLNGDRYRTDELSCIFLRLPHVFRQEHGKPTSYQTPAQSWGDMGAATGALLTMLALQAWARNYARGPRTLVLSGSENGLRSAAILSRGEVHPS